MTKEKAKARDKARKEKEKARNCGQGGECQMIPAGATHREVCYDVIRFWRYVPIRLNALDDKPVYSWQYHDGAAWVTDETACSRRFVQLF